MADAGGALVVAPNTDTAVIAQAVRLGLVCLPGMVPFNIAETGPACFHRGSWGELAAQDHPALRPWLPLFAAAAPEARPIRSRMSRTRVAKPASVRGVARVSVMGLPG